jgi:hypothetical protein
MIRIITGVALAMLSIPAFAKEDLRGISLDMSRGSAESQLSRQCDELLRSHNMVVCFRDLTPSGEWNDRLSPEGGEAVLAVGAAVVRATVVGGAVV